MERTQLGLGKAQVQSLSSGIVDQVLEALFAGKLKPGTFLGTEVQLSEIFQTSRVPIREALSRLTALGVLTVRTGARGGATVAEGDPDQFAIALAVQFMLAGIGAEEIFDLRIAIEGRAAEMAAARATETDVARLRGLLAAVPKGKVGRRMATEKILDLHMGIVEVSQSRTLLTMMHAIQHALVNLYIASTPDMVQPVGSYPRLEKIVNLIAAHDTDGAREAMAAHLESRRQDMIERLGALPEK